jgi:acyl-CoA synthetase (AMP-forming)/AMP-acid ligase II
LTSTALALTTVDLLALHEGGALERIAVVDGERRFTYGDLQRQVETAAARLAELGVCRGDRVIVHLRKSSEEVVAMFACWRIGAVAVNVNAQWTPDQVAYVAWDSGAQVAFIDSRRAGELPSLPPPLRHAVVSGTVPDGPYSGWPTVPARAPEVALLDIDSAAILYTSGSTGMPKGVVLTHVNLLVGARSVARYTRQRPDDRLLSLLPFSFDYGLNQLLTAFLVGARVVLLALAMPSVIVRTLVAEEVTGFAAVPPVWSQLVRYLLEAKALLPALRYVTNSGGAIPPPILEAMPQALPGVQIHLMYGLTEAFRSTTLNPDRFHQKKGSIGRAVPNAETFVVVRGRGLAAPGEEGELVHRGSFISRGYWGKPEATAEKIHSAPELADLIGDEKVVWSGDIVRRDEDGDLWFVSRADSMIKSMGFRLSPTEVEQIIYRSGLVSQVIAFGVPDEIAGQVVEICVAHTAPVDVRSIELHARAHMPSYMVPRRVHVWPGEFPRTASGKLDVTTVVTKLRAMG